MGSVANRYTPRHPHFRLAFACVVGEPNCDRKQNRIADLQSQRYSSTRTIRTALQRVAKSWVPHGATRSVSRCYDYSLGHGVILSYESPPPGCGIREAVLSDIARLLTLPRRLRSMKCCLRAGVAQW